ncbi:MAG: acetolactate synthase 2 catalytic subunit [Acidobacteriota bacterium]
MADAPARGEVAVTGARLLVDAVLAEGVEVVFGYPGGAIMPVYDALLGSGLRHILVRHEQGAALAANGYARATGRVGVCMATSGPGAANLLTGIADAHLDSVPVVAITGQVPSALLGTDAFQELDVLGVFLPVVKHSFLVRDVADLPLVVAEAFRVAKHGRPGPVLVDLPKDIALQRTSARPLTTRVTPPAQRCDRAQLEAARDLNAASRRPVVYGGGGIGLGGAVDAFRAFVERGGLPTVLTLKGLGALDSRHPLLLGMLGMHGSRAANLAVQECDLLVAVGARFDDRVTSALDTFAPDARVLHLDIDPAEMHKRRHADVALLGELAPALAALPAPNDIAGWRDRCVTRREATRPRYDAPGDGVYAPALIRRLCELLPAGAVVTCDVGQHQMWVAQHGLFARPEHHLSSGGLGTMGFGLPAAIGAQLGRPDATVVTVSGDGSFLMNVQELATVARYGLPVKIMVIDNQALGMVRQWQTLFFADRQSEVDLSDNPDFGAVARAFRVPAFALHERDQVEPTLRAWLATPGPALLHVRIDPRANVWPLVPPNASNRDMVGGTDGDDA